MQIQTISQNKLKSNKKIVNQSIRICINCGNVAVKIQNHSIFCKDCGSFFDMERENE